MVRTKTDYCERTIGLVVSVTTTVTTIFIIIIIIIIIIIRALSECKHRQNGIRDSNPD